MLTSLAVQSFKSWADSGNLRLAPITGLFGANSSGKSSLLQLLLLLKQTVTSSDRHQPVALDGPLVDLGTFQELLYQHDSQGVLRFTLRWQATQPVAAGNMPRPGGTVPTSADLRLLVQLDLAPKAIAGANGPRPPLVERFLYLVGLDNPEGSVGMVRDPDSGRYFLAGPSFDYIKRPGQSLALPAPVKCYGFPDETYTTYRNAAFLADLQQSFEHSAEHTYYLGPLREEPHRRYVWTGGVPSDVGMRGERTIEALLAAVDAEHTTASTGAGRAPVLRPVVEALQRLGLISSFAVVPLTPGGSVFEVRARETSSSAEVLLPDVGMGVSQILPVLTLCAYVPERSTVILEQPELHLHPAVQSGLADELIRVVRERRVQIILESHSEHLLRRFQRRIAEEKLAADQAALYFCELQGGASHAIPLHLNEFGYITNWPEGFFGDELGELAAMSAAAIARQSAANAA